MKTANVVLPLALILSISAFFLVYFLSLPVEREVRCGDASIAQERIKETYIEWTELKHTEKCNRETGVCFKRSRGITLSRPVTKPFSYQMYMLLGGLGFVLLFFVLSISLGWKYHCKENVLRFCGIYITGLFITAALAIFLGNMSGNLSPTFIDSCKPNPAVEELCREALIQGKEDFYVKVDCTTDENEWRPARSSSFPLYISLMSYMMWPNVFWSLVLNPNSAAAPLVFVPSIMFVVFMTDIAEDQLEAFLWPDIISGNMLGIVMAVIVFLIYLKIHLEDGSSPSKSLPQTMQDASPDVMNSKTTSPAQAASSGV